MLEKDLKITRSQFLEGKTSLTDEDIISLLDLQPENESRTDIKSYTDKNYSDFENDDASLQRLTENLINNSDYLLYRGSYIAKSKLLYEQSVTLCNEIPSLVIGQEIKESFYLLPYGYAKDSKQNFKQFADILDKTVFTDIKRIYGESLRNNFKKAHKQGKNVFFFICNDKLDSKECENEIKKCVYNRKEIKDKSAKYYFYIEKSKQCLIFDFDSKGKLLKKKKLNIDLKKIKLSTNEELKVVRGRMQSIPSGTLKNLSDNKESVNTFFNSLLLRGEVEMIRRHKELQKYDLKYLNCLEALKQITNQTQSELLQNSNQLFIQSEIESEFYKDLIKEKKRNVALIGKISRSEYLKGKTALTDEDIISLLDLPPEKVAANIETYTEKSYKELKGNPEELARLTKELTSAEYLRYKETFISKSKLLYEQSSVLYNEIPCLIVLNEMKIPAYLLPYEYAKNKQGDTRHFADSLKENAFTDFNRVFNTKIRHSFENGMDQGRDIFFLVNNEKLDKEEIKKQLEKLIKFHKGPDKQGLFLFYSEKDYKCFSFESDYSGKITENNDYELKKLRLAISDKPFTPNLERTNTNERPRSSNLNISPSNMSVNELFYSLLKRGEITALATLKDLSDRENRYYEAVSDMERTNNTIFSDFLKKSNTAFLLKEKQSRFYKDILKIKLQGERTMEKEKIEIQTYKFQNGETIDEILSKQTSWATDAECLDNMIDNSLREVADFADEKENELLKKISIAKNNPEVDLKLLAVQTDAAARYMAAKHYDYRLADVGNRPFSKDFINPYAQDDFPYELPSWIKNHLEEYPNQNEPEHTSEEEKAYQEWEEMLEDNQREENIISHNVLKTKDSEKNISNTQREENSYLNSEELKSSLKKALNEIAKPLEVIPFTRENYNLLFPHSHIISPIENVKLGEHQFEKLDIKERQHILKAVHDTVATPDIIINEKRKTVFDDEKEAHVYAKAFKIDGKNKAVQSVVVSIEDENVSISTHLREINNVVNKIKMPEQLIFASTEIGQMVERLTGKQLGTVNPTRENEIFAPPVTTILQNTENSINYHGLTLTKKDNNLIEPAYDVLLISGIDDKTDSKLIEMLDNTAKWDQYCVLNKSENYIPAIAAEIVEKEKEIKNENVNKSFIQKVQDLKAKVSKSLKKNVAVGVALTSILSANPNLFAQEKPVKLPSEQTILKEAAKEKENLLKIYKDKSPEELLKLLLEANEEKTAAKIQASNLEKSVKELEVKNTKLEFYKEHYKTKSATQESFYDEMKKTQDMYESLKRSSQQDHDILYKHAKIVVNGQERVCHTGLVDGFKNCVTRLDKNLKLNKELVKENNELRKIINQSNQNERNGVSY